MILEYEFCMFLLHIEVFNIMTQTFLTLLKIKQNAPYYIKNLEILNDRIFRYSRILRRIYTFHIHAGNRHKQNSRFCKEIREDNFRFWWRRVHEDASQGMHMSKIEICFFTARILQNQRMLCCGECFHDKKHV